MNKRPNLFVLIAFSISILYGAYTLFQRPKKVGSRGHKKVSTSNPKVDFNELFALISPILREESRKEDNILMAWERRDWGRDPFFSEIFIKRGKVKVSPSNLTLDMVLISGKKKICSINGEILSIGDYILGEKVIDIKRNKVILLGPMGQREIRIKRKEINIKVKR